MTGERTDTGSASSGAEAVRRATVLGGYRRRRHSRACHPRTSPPPLDHDPCTGGFDRLWAESAHRSRIENRPWPAIRGEDPSEPESQPSGHPCHCAPSEVSA
ncbi:hypothetical protein J2Z21_006758 [Streptomyces griseochromogenes]|uniref:Uncharacterized protein n=1 Tax=Streptomyces griseochromogenes TaxID=68214 RepID=A0A1B1B571_9ACTN|nr:hypothetical protein [Streptomyces griseochromogenes]ANP53954.1 hypothetical protein AVL59_34270 [Streptomyces griseochromogenes]MBP2053763.1 hypothetical protein [Streptomyces griseochromogenes]